jgi:hypothetical protein
LKTVPFLPALPRRRAPTPEPPLPFARLRVGGDLLEITEGDLALSATEAAQLLGSLQPGEDFQGYD